MAKFMKMMDDGSWDGDVLANIGAGFCQVQSEKPRQATVINGQWLVQGRCGTNPLKVKTKAVKSQKVAPSLLKERDTAQTERHETKPAWVVGCLRKGRPKVSGRQRVQIKECDKASKTKSALKTANNKASPLKNKIEAAGAKMLKKVIPKSKVLEDKSRSEDSSPEGENLNKEGCVLVQNPIPEGESTKRSIKITIGGTKAQTKR